MKGEKLYESMNHVDDQILERSERRKQSRRRPWWMGAVAAVLVLRRLFRDLERGHAPAGA